MIPVAGTTPFPRIERSVSGKKRVIGTRAQTTRMARNQKMERQPRCWLRRPPKTGLAIKNMSGGERLKVGERGLGQIPDTGAEI